MIIWKKFIKLTTTAKHMFVMGSILLYKDSSLELLFYQYLKVAFDVRRYMDSLSGSLPKGF